MISCHKDNFMGTTLLGVFFYACGNTFTREMEHIWGHARESLKTGETEREMQKNTFKNY